MGALLSFAYGVVAYVLSLATSLYAIGFVANLFVPKSIDTGATGAIGPALAIDLLLLGVFAVQHSVMARRSFKSWWTRIVSPVVERSTFVLASTGALALLLWQWRPIAEPVIWHVHDALAVNLIWAVFWLGWAVMLTSTFLINHFEFFGLSQVAANLSGSKLSSSEFRTPLLYRYVRHPLYLGLLLGFWSTPKMTAGHLLFAIGCTVYILIGIRFEERDLVAQFGERYLRYRRQVGMLVPGRRAS